MLSMLLFYPPKQSQINWKISTHVNMLSRELLFLFGLKQKCKERMQNCTIKTDERVIKKVFHFIHATTKIQVHAHT